MNVLIKSVDIDWLPGKQPGSKYGKASVKYEADGRDKTQTLVSFKNPDVFKKVQDLVGQNVEVEQSKNGDFWEWKSISTASPVAQTPTPGAATATRVSGSNYETKEERAARQVLIVKQSSLSAAVATLAPGAKSALDSKAVLNLAQEFTDWVFAKGEDKTGFDNMDDDIPY